MTSGHFYHITSAVCCNELVTVCVLVLLESVSCYVAVHLVLVLRNPSAFPYLHVLAMEDQFDTKTIGDFGRRGYFLSKRRV